MSAPPNLVPLGSMTSVKRGVQAFLMGAAYAAALAEVKRLVGSGVSLPALTAVYTAEQDGVKSVPYAELLGGGSDPEGDNDESQGERHEIGVLFHNGGQDSEVVTEQLELYLKAVKRLFSKNYGDGSLMPFVGATVQVGSADYSPVEKKDGALMKAGLLTLIVTTFD